MREWAEVAGLFAAGALPLLAFSGLGLGLVRSLDPGARGAERLALAYVFGSGVASLAILGLRVADLPLPLWVLAGIAVCSAPLWRNPASAAAPAAPPTAGWVRAVDGVTLGLALFTFAAALGPETYWDGFEYHLPMVLAWCEGPIRALPGLLDAELRAGIDLLYAPAVCAGAPDAAAAVSAGFAASLAALVRAEARRRASAGAGSLAGAFVLVAPLTLDAAPSSYVDLGVGAYGFTAVLFADRWNRGAAARALTASALALVFATNAKLHAAALAPALLVLVTLGGRPAPARALLRCGAIAALGGVPWLLKAWLTTGNPFFPLLGGWLGTGWASADHLSLRTVRLATDFPAPRSPLGFAHYLASLALGRNPHLSGLLGALPLALLPAAVHRTTRATGVLVAVLGALFALQFAFMPALRFGTPLLPFAAIGAAFGGARIAATGRGFAGVLAALLALLALHHGAAMAARYVPRVAALRAPRAYEDRVFPDQASLRELVAGAPGVVAISKGAMLWMPRPVYILHWERNGELFFDPVRGHYTEPSQALRLLRERGVESLVVDVERATLAAGRTGWRTLDAWLAGGEATLRSDIAPRPARGGRVYVRIDLR